MRPYFLTIEFETHTSSSGFIKVSRTIRVFADSILAAARDAEHICNGYRLGTSLDATLTRVTLRPSPDFLETRSDFLKGLHS